MDILDIAGRTRSLGAPKNWNAERDGPCGGLPVRDEPYAPGINKMISEWKPNEIELEHLKLGAPIQLGIIGTIHPVVSLGVGAVPPREREEPAARMSRIQTLMADLEAGPSEPNGVSDEEQCDQRNTAVFDRSRQLILDLMGISAKPVGEQIAAALDARAKAEAKAMAGDDGAGDLGDMLKFTRRWLPECFPADDDGQIPFARVLCDSLMDAAEVHMKRTAKLEQGLEDAYHEALDRDERSED